MKKKSKIKDDGDNLDMNTDEKIINHSDNSSNEYKDGGDREDVEILRHCIVM